MSNASQFCLVVLVVAFDAMTSLYDIVFECFENGYAPDIAAWRAAIENDDGVSKKHPDGMDLVRLQTTLAFSDIEQNLPVLTQLFRAQVDTRSREANVAFFAKC